jgi:hypothetical protein
MYSGICRGSSYKQAVEAVEAVEAVKGKSREARLSGTGNEQYFAGRHVVEVAVNCLLYLFEREA